jgi:hypothetical protein
MDHGPWTSNNSKIRKQTLKLLPMSGKLWSIDHGLQTLLSVIKNGAVKCIKLKM